MNKRLWGMKECKSSVILCLQSNSVRLCGMESVEEMHERMMKIELLAMRRKVCNLDDKR